MDLTLNVLWKNENQSKVNDDDEALFKLVA